MNIRKLTFPVFTFPKPKQKCNPKPPNSQMSNTKPCYLPDKTNSSNICYSHNLLSVPNSNNNFSSHNKSNSTNRCNSTYNSSNKCSSRCRLKILWSNSKQMINRASNRQSQNSKKHPERPSRYKGVWKPHLQILWSEIQSTLKWKCISSKWFRWWQRCRRWHHSLWFSTPRSSHSIVSTLSSRWWHKCSSKFFNFSRTSKWMRNQELSSFPKATLIIRYKHQLRN